MLRIEALYELTLRHWISYQKNKQTAFSENFDKNFDENSAAHTFYTKRDAKQLDLCVRKEYADYIRTLENMERYLTKIYKKYQSILKRIKKMNK